MRVATFNLASGRGAGPVHLPADRVRAALASLRADVVCLQEVDVAQPRSHGTHQVEVAAETMGTPYWRFVPTLAGTPSPVRGWHRVHPDAAHGHDGSDGSDGSDGGNGRPLYGVAVLSRRPVRDWHVLELGHGRGRLPLRAPDPFTGADRWWWIPDEPRVAVAAELDDCTVVSTHLSFSPPTAVRQLRLLRRWAAGLRAPVIVAGDLNLPGQLPARLLGLRRLVAAPTFPGDRPRIQLDHVVGPAGVTAHRPAVERLDVGDHRAVSVTLRW